MSFRRAEERLESRAPRNALPRLEERERWRERGEGGGALHFRDLKIQSANETPKEREEEKRNRSDCVRDFRESGVVGESAHLQGWCNSNWYFEMYCTVMTKKFIYKYERIGYINTEKYINVICGEIGKYNVTETVPLLFVPLSLCY